MILNKADIEIGGTRPWDISVNDERFFERVLADGQLGAGESYLDGWWDCPSLDQMACRFLNANLGREMWGAKAVAALYPFAKAKLVNLQNRRRSKRVAKVHYDLGNDFFEAMLDSRMIYSCAYWPTALDLDQAQKDKLDLVCRKLKLEDGIQLLDIGCGWGGFLEFAATQYGARGLGITISSEQAKKARERLLGLPVDILTQDYRDLEGSYDRIASIGALEHVGPKNLGSFMNRASAVLKKEGIFLIQFIASSQAFGRPNEWMDKYIFPGGYLPTLSEALSASEDNFVVEDVHGFGPDYDKTLLAWYHRFQQSWPRFSAKYGERFYRMWSYYLLTCAASFRTRSMQLYQVTLSKRPRTPYRSVR